MGATDRFDSSDLLADGTPGDLADLAEIERYADTVAAFAEGTIPEDRFTTARLQQGCYGQRQPGVNMLRIKAPGGKLAAVQLDALADVVASFSQPRCARACHHARIDPDPLHPAGPHPGRDAPAGAGRPDHARGLRPHGAQHDRLLDGRARARRSTSTSTST